MQLHNVGRIEGVLTEHAAEVVGRLAVLEAGHQRHRDRRNVVVGPRGLALHLLLQAADHVAATRLAGQHREKNLGTTESEDRMIGMD